MTYVDQSHVVVGTPTTADQYNQTIDNVSDINARTSSVTATTIMNGSFENDGQCWDISAYPTGTYAFDTDAADVYEGTQSLAVSQATSGGSNGGAIVSTNSSYLIPCVPGEGRYIQWYTKSSAADVSNKLEIQYYDEAGNTSGGAVTLWSDSTTNPTSWTKHHKIFVPPAAARQFAVIFTLGVQGGNLGTTHLDGVKFIVNPCDDDIIVREETLHGNGSVCAIGSSYVNRNLTQLHRADKYGTFASDLVGYKVTINVPGTYEIQAYGSASCSTHPFYSKINIYDGTSSASVSTGNIVRGINNSCEASTANTVFSVSVATDIYLKQIAVSSGSVNGGLALNDGSTNEVHASLHIRRIGDAT